MRSVPFWQVCTFSFDFWACDVWDKIAFAVFVSTRVPSQQTGSISEVELGAQTIIYQLSNVIYMVMIPFNAKIDGKSVDNISVRVIGHFRF